MSYGTIFGSELGINLFLAGQSARRNSSLEDMSRVKFLQAYIGSVLDAIRFVLPYQP